MVRLWMLAVLAVAGPAAAQCRAGERFVALPVPVPARVALVADSPTFGRGTPAGCSGDESGIDCAFAPLDAARKRALHRDVAARAQVGWGSAADGGVCVPAQRMAHHHLRWAAGALPLDGVLPWRSDVFAPKRDRRAGPSLLPFVLDVRGVDGGAGGDVEALLFPSGAVVHTRGGRFEGVVLGPVHEASILPDEPERPATYTLLDEGEGQVLQVGLAPAPPPLDVEVVGAADARLVVYGWSDKALAYDGEPATPQVVPVQRGRARLRGLKPWAESFARRYVVTATAGSKVAAAVVTAEQRRVTLRPGPPAVLRLSLHAKRGPVDVERYAFFESTLEPSTPEPGEEPPSPCDFGSGAWWGEQPVRGGGGGQVTVSVPPGRGRCVRVWYSRPGGEGGVTHVLAPEAPGVVARQVELDE